MSSPYSLSPSPFATLQINLTPTLGLAFVGMVLASILYGFTVLQTISYYRRYPNDRLSLKILVGALWSLNTTSLAFKVSGLYTWLVLDYAQVLLLPDVPWGIYNEPAIVAVIALAVNFFLSALLPQTTDQIARVLAQNGATATTSYTSTSGAFLVGADRQGPSPSLIPHGTIPQPAGIVTPSTVGPDTAAISVLMQTTEGSNAATPKKQPKRPIASFSALFAQPQGYVLGGDFAQGAPGGSTARSGGVH
ncbi:hypothetical protein CONPUDRAFT_166285 [Coniophora puteana RWD-64-598 SS2]|uniref:Uncharacterized protein n=1 Tax=Coniophora puteana (strain RWD-64-598) TaxID=741705 RepID=A0A5M3MKD1_CONPW|nr:uncharacterized protein CONPUDRAFT_166285 [Coniophora puteana RWD-64-598 SS2]EIW79533.1 hypothetical protein CONPUDRAFT_166285 [Coniophora puteana RWD-64-598 SS2]